MTETFQKSLKLIPREGEFWKSFTEETFNAVADKLLTKGFTEDEAYDILDRMYWAISGEYGN